MFIAINPVYLIAFMFLVTCICYLFFTILSVVYNPESKIRRDYLITGVLLALFSLFYGIMTIAENEMLRRVSWAGGFISGFLFFPSWILFLLNMIRIKHRRTGQLVKLLFAVTAVIAVLCVISNDAVLTMTRFGNQFSYQNSVFFMGAFIYASILGVVLFIFQIKWLNEAELKRHRKFVLAFTASAGLALPVGLITEFVIPIFTRYTVVPLGSVTILVAAMPIYVSLITNKMLSITVRNVSGLTFSSVKIPILVLDHKNNIGLENEAAITFFGRSVLGKNMADTILHDQTSVEQSFFDKSFANGTVTALTPFGTRLCDMLLAVERDKLGDAFCKVVILWDMTENKYKDTLLETVNRVSSVLLESDITNFENDLFAALGMMARAVDVDRVYIWKNHTVDGYLYATQVYEWSKARNLSRTMNTPWIFRITT